MTSGDLVCIVGQEVIESVPEVLDEIETRVNRAEGARPCLHSNAENITRTFTCGQTEGGLLVNSHTFMSTINRQIAQQHEENVELHGNLMNE